MSERPAASTDPPMLAEQANRLSELFEAHGDRLYRLARRLASNADDALDLVQETFLKAARHEVEPSHPTAQYDNPETAFLIRTTV